MNQEYLSFPQGNYSTTPTGKMLRFESWRQVPAEFRTKRQWQRAGRKVKKGEKPTAEVIYPRWLEDNELENAYPTDPNVLSYQGWGVLVTDEPTPLFHFDQTKPYKATKRTLAYNAYEALFYHHSLRHCWIKKTEKDGCERQEWFTNTEDFLTEEIVRSHLNGKHIVGIRATDMTWWIKIDLDYHGRDQQVFEQQAEILLEVFYGHGWHYEVKRDDVTGLNLIKVLSKPMKTEKVRAECRKLLQELDAQHPELAKVARAAGMKTLAQLEIYPSEKEGTRLPLCRDRVVFLDKPLPLITNRKRQVQDVETYIAWLNDPNRQYMPKEKILGYLHYFAWPANKPKPEKVSIDWANGEIGAGGWHGNTRRFLHAFWLEGNANGRPLNEHLAVLCRLAARYGYSQETIVERLTAFVDELPASATLCSSRLLRGRLDKIEGVIKSSAKYACSGNNHQADAALSTQKIDQVLKAWPEFDPLDKGTWTLRKPVQKSSLVPNWSDEMKQKLCIYFRKPLFMKDEQVIIRFINAAINLTLDKEEQRQGWHKDFLLTWMRDKFPEIKSAKAAKRQKIMKALEEVGIIRLVSRGHEGHSCSRWTLGKTARQALGMVEDQEQVLLPQVSELLPIRTSISSRSLFQEKYDQEWRRAMLEVVGEQFERADQPLLAVSEHEVAAIEGEEAIIRPES